MRRGPDPFRSVAPHLRAPCPEFKPTTIEAGGCWSFFVGLRQLLLERRLRGGFELRKVQALVEFQVLRFQVVDIFAERCLEIIETPHRRVLPQVRSVGQLLQVTGQLEARVSARKNIKAHDSL